MQPGQIGRRECRWIHWIALAGAMLLAGACQSSGPLDGSGSSPAMKRASAQPAVPNLSGGPVTFIGLGDGELFQTLGQPKQVRKDAPAEVWQYAGADCVVDFYLYSGDSGLSVAYLEARNQAAESTPADRCVTSLLRSVNSGDTQQTAL